MSYTFRIDTEAARERVIDFIRRVPLRVIATVKEEKRSTEQNAAMWAMLTDIANQCELGGRRHNPDTWKAIFLHELGHKSEFVPSLDGQSFIPLGYRSSRLGKQQMSDLLESISAYGAEQNVRWSNEEQAA